MTIAAPSTAGRAPERQEPAKEGGRRPRRPAALRLSSSLTLPIEYVTKTAAIFAQRRKGKTYTASVIAEELVALMLPFVVLDPTGAWWGLRASADGKKAGLPVVVIGGQHGDLPLERGAGGFIADLVLDHPGWYVLDLSLLDSRAAEREFATAFAERLYRRKMQPGMDFPLHLFVDEADMFVPQEKEGTGDVRMLGAFQAIVRRGGLHGLGSTLISQRPALVNKSVLTQLDLLILLRLVAGNDQDAVDKNYISRSSTKEQRATLMDSLASLRIGEAWFFEPGAEPEPLLKRVQVRERDTFNSSATPKPGEARIEPRVLADVDLDTLRTRMAETLDRAKQDDPAELKKQIRSVAALEKQIADLTAEVERRAVGSPAVEGEWDTYFRELGWINPDDPDAAPRVEVVALGDDITRMLSVLRHFTDGADRVEASRQAILGLIEPLAEKVERLLEPKAPPAGRVEREAASVGAAAPPRSGRVGTRPSAPPRAHEPARPAGAEPSGTVSGPQQGILDAIAWFEAIGVQDPKRNIAASVAGVSGKSSGFRANVSTLSGLGLVTYPAKGRISLTEEGRSLARIPEAAPTHEALHNAICSKLSGPQADLLRILIDAYPGAVTREDLAAEAGVSSLSSGFRANVSTLSGWELVTYPAQGTVAADPILFP